MTDLSNDVQVEKRTSAKGREYTITRRAGAKPPGVAATIQASSDSKEDFGVQITWDPQDNSTWNATSQDLQDTASISSYYLIKNSTDSDGTVHCTINFENTKHYDYHFYDETGDSYECNTFENTTHYVNYFSKKPNLRFVTGS